MSQKFRLKNIDETRNYFLEEKKQYELMSRRHKKVCTTLNYFEHFLVLTSTITGCLSSSALASLIAIITGIKKYKSIINKKKEKHDETVLIAKSKSKSIEVLISKALID